jgi:ethanolamine transporter
MAIFAIIAAIDRIFGNKLGLGKEFEKGIHMMGELTLAMMGMIVLSPVLGALLSAPLTALYNIVPIDPSSFIGSILACDMGGGAMALQLSASDEIGYFNGLVVASMMGATVSFTLPFVMGAVKKEQRKNMLLGILCGICTIPVGCFVGGLISGIAPLTLLINLAPLIVLAVILALGIIFIPNVSVKIFNIFGIAIRTVVILGLVVGILEYLTGVDMLPYTDPTVTLEGAEVIFNIACVMAGAFPLLHIISKLISKPLSALGKKTGMNEKSVLGFISSLATSATTFGMMKDMDDRGVVLNSAFAVSGAFLLADHLAYTISFKAEYLPAVMVGKIISGVLAVALAAIIYKKSEKKSA